jgi:hypothetical protein
MSKRILSRIATAVLATGLASAGLVAGSSGPANAEAFQHSKPPAVTSPTDSGADGWTVDSGGFTTQKVDTGWG